MDKEITNHLALSFDPSDSRSLQDETSTLISIEGGSIEVEMSETRGKCSKIASIYTKFLDPWFRRVLNSDEEDSVSRVFAALSSSDD